MYNRDREQVAFYEQPSQISGYEYEVLACKEAWKGVEGMSGYASCRDPSDYGTDGCHPRRMGDEIPPGKIERYQELCDYSKRKTAP